MKLRLCTAALIALTLLSGCGGSDDSSDPDDSSSGDSTDSETSGSEDTDPETDPDTDPDAGAGEASGSVTLADGTAYTFSMSTCDTSGNSDKFLVDPGYDLFGTSDEGASLQLIRAGTSEDSANPNGSIEAEGVELVAVGSQDLMLTVDGGAVGGTVVFMDFSSGADVEATVEISC